MDLNKENMKKMRELIVFTIILLIALWNYKLLFEWIGFAFGIVTPFLIGGGIAFVLNVPMSFFEETLFGNKRVKEKKLAKRLARPLSLVLTELFINFAYDRGSDRSCRSGDVRRYSGAGADSAFAWKDNTGICIGGTAFSGRVIYRQQ